MIPRITFVRGEPKLTLTLTGIPNPLTPVGAEQPTTRKLEVDMNRFGNRKAALEFSKWGMAQEVNDWHSVTGTLDQLGGLPAGLGAVPTAGDMLFNVLAMVAEFEADLIRLRTREGMKVAKAKGRLRGKQPKLNPRQEAHMVALLKSGEYSSAELGDLFGVARSTVYRAVERDAARKRAQRQTTASIH